MTEGLGGSLDADISKVDTLTSKVSKLKEMFGGVATAAKTMSSNITTNMVMGGTPGTQAAQAMSSAAGYVANKAPSMFGDPMSGATWTKAMKAAGGTFGAIAGLLPTTQETVNMASMAERMRFYSNNMNNSMGSANPRIAANNIPGYQYSAMSSAMRAGTSIGPDDITQAINSGVKMGLSPGLSNYNVGGGFSGILGGAALASNLSPGIGLTGGMGVMGNINSAGSVNMLRMLGVNVRGQDGKTMNDLPQIIDQLYGIITKNNPNPTPGDIATSLMPGNALDSLISQYFGGDPNTREVIVAGLIQRVKTGQSLRQSGSKMQLGFTGGTNKAISSISNRNQAESQLIQGFTDTTNKSMIATDNLLQKLYTALGEKASSTDSGSTIRGVQDISTAFTTLGGARNGAGANILNSILKATGSGLGTLLTKKGGAARFKPGAMLTLLGGAGLGALVGINSADNFMDNNNVSGVNRISNFSDATSSAQSTIDKQFTGDITINVTVPPGSDPYTYKSTLVDIWQ